MSKSADIDPGDMQIYDNDLPGLKAANYEIKVEQALPNAATDNYSTTINQKFVVQGPQFTIDASEVHAMFPANNANGNYGQVLPSIILETQALPWERLITGDPAVPWVALLVFQQSEVELDPKTNSPLVTSSFPAHWDPKLRIPRGQVVAAASIVSPKY